MGLDKKSQQMDTNYNSCTPKKGKTETFPGFLCLQETITFLQNNQMPFEDY